MTILYSVLHFLVDGVCAMAMFGTFIPRDGGYFYILLYNFCAFALQMPFGVLLDALHAGKEARKENLSSQKTVKKNRDPDLLTAVIGVLLTIAGAVTHPVVLGIGNALFHVGGGVGTIRGAGDRLIARLGVFVAPGALGLYLGRLLAQKGGWHAWLLGVSVLMLLVCVGMLYACQMPKQPFCEKTTLQPDRAAFRLAGCCLLVVILRSYIGMAVSFSWKTGVAAGIFSVLAVVGGKMMGGFLSARKDSLWTAVVSLVLAALCYLGSSVMPFGLAALFFFNMTMPITLYWMVCAFPKMPGFAFGGLTFALFVGFLPAYFGVQLGFAGNVTGSAGSILSLALLLFGIGTHWRNGETDRDALCLSAEQIGKNRCERRKP